ncbi:MAG: hypothetical protein CO183_00230 [Candidatus Zambryskibacteria bacterium CG_4_9_14_3_um_filter_42_9]|uniref:SHS2 domain-containing protein n=1 Tax=Candidatus Zambryskibacteria bacterium CG22_combo_CG10-13_8_21_14_all_42_17 TaxID=1975118 RepID=A0A2H0BDT5_9BACT|nr:MAG: hypothetical protein COX06_01325 [Candidatus Zambryskibacteria bacterium CG22_combo_CG10-13_8_21_14_all_42_17]PJA37057.1 MAG: hypothetical protein CO183_00230 [Candidatus Zambryskibacteria bacterium CG_4_9_14_3_um_filter_42_9]
MIPLLGQKIFLDLFPAPEFLLLSTAGIVIADNDTKFVQLRREILGGGFKLINSSKFVNPPGTVESGLINNPDNLKSVLRDISKRFHIHYTHATLPEEKSYLFTATIDWVPHSGLRDAVAFIIEENVPISLAESVFDFEIIRENESVGEIRLAVSVLPKHIVDSYVNVFESAGIIPISFNLESQAIARAVIHHKDKRSYLIINLTRNKTGFYVVEEGIVQFSTTRSCGLNEDDSYPDVDELKTEMKKIIDFWNTSTDKTGKMANKIEKILLCGLGASKARLVEKIMDKNEISHALSDVWLNISSSREQVSLIPFDASLDYASAIGLVLPRHSIK